MKLRQRLTVQQIVLQKIAEVEDCLEGMQSSNYPKQNLQKDLKKIKEIVRSLRRMLEDEQG
tara:strand:- start:308 stop:490 length:183 start_codon:yes stop_codon:yes gene_type:complete